MTIIHLQLNLLVQLIEIDAQKGTEESLFVGPFCSVRSTDEGDNFRR
jgi:hypothetical protein